MNTPWKAVLRNFIPIPVLRIRSRLVVKAYAKEVSNLPLRDKFSRTYARGDWGTSEGATFFSGPGSLPAASASEEAIALALLNEDPSLVRIIDVGCGDFQVGRRLIEKVPREIEYAGCDIVPELIAFNQTTFGSANVRFQVCDLTVDEVPKGDIVLCRQVLQHLSNDNILHALERISAACRFALITNTIPNARFKANQDMPDGPHTRNDLGSGLVLEEPPFGLKPLQIHENQISACERLRTLVVQFQ
jgi:SAM-dependent methyltransferase